MAQQFQIEFLDREVLDANDDAAALSEMLKSESPDIKVEKVREQGTQNLGTVLWITVGPMALLFAAHALESFVQKFKVRIRVTQDGTSIFEGGADKAQQIHGALNRRP